MGGNRRWRTKDLRGRPRAPAFSIAATIAKAGFNRWLVPPAALAIHLCIGMAYGFSVFWLPLGRAVAARTGRRNRSPAPGTR